jgi:adenylate cyclase
VFSDLASGSPGWNPSLPAWLSVRSLRLASGLVLFAYITAHLINHALGLVSLAAAEAGLGYAVELWYSLPGTVLLYGAAAIHFTLALWAVYERRTFRLPPIELLRIALGFTLPLILINHAANTRLAYDLFGLSSDYTRVVANLWLSDQQGMQLGLLAPGWLHGCLGLHFILRRRPLYRHLRLALFAVMLLVPVFSGMGFIAMGKELRTNAEAAAAARDYQGPAHAGQRLALAHTKDRLLIGYLSLIGLALAARGVRNAVERGTRRLISISYPGRSIQVPRGWSVLEASRGFHLAHASMCGGRARCSTCRIRVIAGEQHCPAAEAGERATLQRIGAAPDVRLACQLRPTGDISVVPLVRTERPIYRASVPQRSAEREIVVLVCDFVNRAELASEHLPQDMLYVLTLYVDALVKAIRGARGVLSYVEPDSICALFGLEGSLGQAARHALQAASAIDEVMADLNERFGRQWHCKAEIVVSLHAGRAVVGEIGSSDPPAVMAVGEAVDTLKELREAGAARRSRWMISEPVCTAAGLDAPVPEKIVLPSPGGPICVFPCASPPLPPGASAAVREPQAPWRRLWGV